MAIKTLVSTSRYLKRDSKEQGLFVVETHLQDRFQQDGLLILQSENTVLIEKSDSAVIETSPELKTIKVSTAVYFGVYKNHSVPIDRCLILIQSNARHTSIHLKKMLSCRS